MTWRSTVGWSSRAIKKYDLVDQKEFVQLTYEGLRNGYVYGNGMAWADAEAAARASLSAQLGGEHYNPFKKYDADGNNLYTWDNIIDPATGQVRPDAQSVWDENWMDAIKKDNAFRHEHQLSVNGGTDRTKYIFSLGYVNEDGILKTTNFQRYNGRANIDTQVTNWFKTNINVSLAHSKTNLNDYEDTSTSNVWYTAQFISPLFPTYLKDLDGNDVLDSSGNRQLDYGDNKELGLRFGNLSDFNSLGGLVDDKAERQRDIAGLRTGMVFGTDDAKAGWLQGVKLSLNFGLDYENQLRMRYMNMYHGNQAKAGGLIQK